MDRLRSAAFAGLVLLLTSCKDDILSLSDIVGTYTATSFTMQSLVNPTPVNILTAGGSIQITLNADHTTTGSIFVPPAIDGGISASLAGTFVLQGNEVTFTQTADTFIRDVTWTVSGHTLTGSDIFSGVQVSVTLTRP